MLCPFSIPVQTVCPLCPGGHFPHSWETLALPIPVHPLRLASLAASLSSVFLGFAKGTAPLPPSFVDFDDAGAYVS